MGIDWGIFREFREMMGGKSHPPHINSRSCGWSQVCGISLLNHGFVGGVQYSGDGIITNFFRDFTVMGNFYGGIFHGFWLRAKKNHGDFLWDFCFFLN